MINSDLENLEIFLNKALLITDQITTKIHNDELMDAIDLLDNRERLIGIITQFYERISLYSDLIKRENAPKINRLNKYLEILFEQSSEIEKLLVDNKKEIQIQIAKAYKNKENLKGYNLNNFK